MATAEEGGATASTSSYGGGGAGGKFTKKSFRKAATPYDRPLPAPRRNDNNGSWLSKMVVEPASKLINYGAHRLFASLFRKRLPPPTAPQTSEINNGPSGGLPEAVPHTQQGAQEPSRGECSQPMDSSKSSGISELEQLLKQKTFTRSEIGHLTELLQSRAGEVSFSDGGKRYDETANEFGRHQQFVSSPMEGNKSGGDRSHGMMSTPMSNSQVLGDSIASPAELAKAFMGSRPSKVSPSMLGMRSPVSREDPFLSSTRFASKSPVMSLRTNTSAGRGAPDNGFITPRSRGRSAIYNMSRPLNSTGNGINSNGYAGLAMSPASLSSVEPDERFGPKSMTLKRRSSVLDDDVGSVSSIRRIRQKSNAIAPRIPHTSDSKQKQPLISEQKHVGKTVVENADQGFPSTSYDPVPSSSSEVASRILRHLEKLTPKQKSSDYKFVDVREKSTFKLTQNMLCGQALRSMEDLSSSKLLLDLQDDNKPASSSKATLPVASGSTSQQGKVEENSPQKSYTPMNNDSAVTVKASGFNAGTSKSVVETGLSEPPQKKRAFRMSAVEDFLDFDDDIECNGLASQPSVEGRGPVGSHTTDNISPVDKPKFVRTTISPEVKLPSGHVSSETSDRSPGTFMVGEGSSSVPLSNSEAATTAVQSAVFPVSVAAFDKPKETNSPPPLFSFSSKAADKFLFSSESSSRTPEAKPESPNSMVNVPVPSGAPMKSPDIEKGSQLNPPKTDDRNAETVPSAASNGPLHSSPLAGSFTTASFKETNEKSTAAAPLLFTPSTSIDNFVPSGTGTSSSTASSGSIFGLAAPSSNVTGSVFKFGASTEPSTAVSAATTTIVPLGGDSKTNADTDPSTGSSSSALSNVVPFGSTSSVHGMFGLSSSVSHSTANNNLQGSLFGNASKPFVSGLETASQGTSFQSVAPASSPSFSINNTAPVSFGFSSSSASSTVTTGAVIPSNAVSSSSNAAPSTFSFGFSSSSSSTNAVGLSTGGGVFSFGAGSSVSSAPVVNTASSFSSGTTTSGVFSFGANSSSSSAINSASSSSAPSTNAFGSTWQNPKPSVFGSTITSAPPSTGFAFGSTVTSAPPSTGFAFGSTVTSAPPSTGFAFGSTTTSAPPSTGFAFGSSSTTSAPTNAAPGFSFNTPSPSVLPVFGNAPSGFGASPVNNNDQMSAEDSMAEDTVQSTAPSVPAFGQTFGQTPVSPSPTGFMFGSTPPSQGGNNNPFPFGAQQQNNQVAPQNPSPFQASNSLEFNAGGSFSLGSGAGDKAGRKFVKIGRSKNRKK
ncbi:hypothetical protein ABFX02_06G151900 [Erythranthe guttata]